MPEAMALIRADLGRDAVILHTEKVRRRGFWGLFGWSQVEITAAIDKDLRDFPQPTPAADKSIQSMQRELAALREMLAQMGESRQSTGIPRVTSLNDWYQRLVSQGVAERLASRIVQTVADELNRWALDNDTVLNEHLHWYLGRQLPRCEPLKLVANQPHVFFIVGPTGVGKTTTIAKLAANFSQGARVLMITADTFRVAAIPQLQTFGEILNVPVEVAYSPNQLAGLVSNQRQFDLILVDTPGRSHRAFDEVAELGQYLAAVPDKSVHLALNAGTRYEDMYQTVESFRAMPLDGLIFTKIDETGSLGAAYSLACETGLSLSYLTNGQHVPEDIELASPERIVDLLVGSVPDDTRSLKPRYAEHRYPRLEAIL